MAKCCKFRLDSDQCQKDAIMDSGYCGQHHDMMMQFEGKRNLRLSRADALLLHKAIETGEEVLRTTLSKAQWVAVRQVCSRYRAEFNIKQ